MSNTEKITNEVYDRHMPSENLLFHLEHDRLEPANEIEYREYRNGRPYIDCDGEWRIGRDYKLRETPPPEPEGPPMLGVALIVCAGMVVTYGLAWLVWAFWPIIRPMMGW